MKKEMKQYLQFIENNYNKPDTDKEKLAKYAKILYAEACLIGGVSLENPGELCELISELMV